VALGAIRLSHGTEGFLAIMAGAAELTLCKRGLSHFALASFHLENFGMAVRALGLLLGDMGLMAENNRTRAALSFVLDIAPAHFLLLPVGRAQADKTYNANADE